MNDRATVADDKNVRVRSSPDALEFRVPGCLVFPTGNKTLLQGSLAPRVTTQAAGVISQVGAGFTLLIQSVALLRPVDHAVSAESRTTASVNLTARGVANEHAPVIAVAFAAERTKISTVTCFRPVSYSVAAEF